VQSHRGLPGRLSAALPILASALAPLTPHLAFVVASLAPLLGGDRPEQTDLHDAHSPSRACTRGDHVHDGEPADAPRRLHLHLVTPSASEERRAHRVTLRRCARERRPLRRSAGRLPRTIDR
jgi:hypothetical protein